MHSRFFFRWTFVVSASVVFSLFLAALPGEAIVKKASAQQSRITQGSLVAFDKDGQPPRFCPLKHTAVKAEISGFLSRVTVTQQFENPFPDKIEAVYTFPLPQNAAVDDLTMIVGTRSVKGKVMRKEQAQAVYEAARAGGQVASLLEQERANIFRQSVANILPGERVTVTISYVETLKYEEGTYEFVFPMVVGPRYIPAGEAERIETAAPVENEPVVEADAVPASSDVPDAARISPPVMPEGMRAGHDISIEVTLDAGVPIDALNSATHEVELERPEGSRAVVRLQDQETIPNRDFILRYDVAGRKVEDAVLTHRSERGGFFTLILQPPDRVTVEDVTPKEIVFVLDTSGSMSGFPVEKARETIVLALDNLYPQDTFNLITFSGDEHVLFSEPVPATPANLAKAKKFLDGRDGNGGTEMMKAIRAALDPSDAQQHIRIACFMTDGQVGNDMDIIAAVQKHRNARVFAMGFGSSPNRFLLDKMAEYGRGEVEYVTEGSADAKAVAQRFHERVRNPLLTDISIDWSSLPIEDVYPQRIPDLFSARPVILSGRFTTGGRGVIRLRGKMSGRDFVREIPIELPASEPQHDVLATLWARQRIDALMGQDMNGLQAGKMKKELREEITRLGLEYRLLTQFTSFVAVEETMMTNGNAPRRVDVATETPAATTTAPATAPAGVAANVYPVGPVVPGGVSETVTITDASSSEISMTEGTRVVTVSQRGVENLPLRGRSVFSLAMLPAGIVAAGNNQSGQMAQNQMSVNGQRASENAFLIDGLDANAGIASGQNTGATIAGSQVGQTASGGTNSLVSAEAIEEVEVTTMSFSAEYGRATGGQINVVTKAGTNEFHGSLYETFGNDAFDANDWFANSRALRQPPRRLNNFGGTLGGPARRDRTFFFAAYEGLRLRQPLVGLTDVPAIGTRNLAPANLQPFLNAFPLPNGGARADGFAEFAGSFTNPARHDALSLRVDEMPTNNLSLYGRYNYATSEAEERGVGGFSLNTLNKIRSTTQSLAAGASYTISPNVITNLRGSYNRLGAQSSSRLDDFGGSIVPATSSPSSSFFAVDANNRSSFDLNGRNAALLSGGDTRNVQRQFNLNGSLTTIAGAHTLKFGADYRQLSPLLGVQPFEQNALFNRASGALTGTAARLNFITRTSPQRPSFHSLSLYGQDEWRATSRLSLTYGVRWELSPPPSGADERTSLATTSSSDPAGMSLAPQGSTLWKTTYGNFAPRVGLAYQLSPATGRQLVLRAGFGVVYDLSNEEAGLAFTDSAPYLNGQAFFDVPFSSSLTGAAINTHSGVPFIAFDSRLKLPYTLQWSLGVERELGSEQTISAAYVGTSGRRLLLAETLLDAHPDFAFVRLVTNGARSDYHSLQLQFQRRLSRGLHALAFYTWANSIDDAAQDSPTHVLLRSRDREQERGPSDFDVRHVLNGVVSYDIPQPSLRAGWSKALLRNWTIQSVFNLRSSRPVNVVYDVPTPYGFAALRPDLLAGVPLYLSDATAAAQRRINPAAFVIPDLERQGTLGRNSLRGFPLYQFDFGLSRRFSFTESVNLQLKLEAFNLFNHPNFADPAATDTSLGSRLSAAGSLLPNPTFGTSASMLGRSILSGPGSGFNSFYQTGGPRTLQFSLKLQF